MKRILTFFVLATILLSCTISFPGNDLTFDEKVATQSSVVMTATALSELLKEDQTETQPVNTPKENTPEAPTATPPGDDPEKDLGQSSWRDDLSSWQNWFKVKGDQVYGDTRIFHQDGYLGMTSDTTSEGITYWLNYLEIQNAYLEAEFDIGSCSGNDQYGLVIRAPDYESGFGYYFSVTCDGKYDLRRWNSSGSKYLLDFPEAEAIHSGKNQTNVLGIWADGSTIRLYVNNQFLKEINDSSLTGIGHFGLFINAKQTPGFTIKMDECAYWLLN